MGDRANVLVKDRAGDKGVYLYTHWEGTELPATLQRALAKRCRWDDPAYLARIIFCEMVKGQEAEETGYGIALWAPDGEHRVLEVICQDETVNGMDFDEFIALSADGVAHYWESYDGS